MRLVRRIGQKQLNANEEDTCTSQAVALYEGALTNFVTRGTGGRNLSSRFFISFFTRSVYFSLLCASFSTYLSVWISFYKVCPDPYIMLTYLNDPIFKDTSEALAFVHTSLYWYLYWLLFCSLFPDIVL